MFRKQIILGVICGALLTGWIFHQREQTIAAPALPTQSTTADIEALKRKLPEILKKWQLPKLGEVKLILGNVQAELVNIRAISPNEAKITIYLQDSDSRSHSEIAKTHGDESLCPKISLILRYFDKHWTTISVFNENQGIPLTELMDLIDESTFD